MHNFRAGPAILPQIALDRYIEAFQKFSGTILPVTTISHRSKEFLAVVEEAQSMAKELLQILDGYSILFLQGGTSTQFYMLALTLLKEGKTAHYLNTGSWASKVAQEAKLVGDVNAIASFEDQNFNYIPKGYKTPSDSADFHITTTNRIYGAEIHENYAIDEPIVADMSSDIFSRPVDVSKYDLIYVGVQKNIGPAGTILVIVKNEILGKVNRTIPAMLDYTPHIKKDSMCNTPPVFPIFVVEEIFKWLKPIGGVSEIYKKNKAKAAKLYAEINANPIV